METINIGELPFPASRIGLGTWSIGGWMWGGSDARAAIRTIQAAIDQGITLIDTAPVYGFGRSEELVGQALRTGNRRDGAIIATKCGLEWRDGQVFVLSERLGEIRWVQVHRRIGERLEQSYGPQTPLFAAQLALHFMHGHVPHRAVQYLHQAGEQALPR